MKLWISITWVAAAILAIISLALPTWQWASLPATTDLQWGAGLAAFALGLTKLSFFPLAWENARTGKILPAAILLSFATAALFITTLASRDLFTNIIEVKKTELEQVHIQKSKQVANDKQQQQANDFVYQSKKQQLIALNGRIKTLDDLIADDSEARYATRAYAQADKIKALEIERATLINSLKLPTSNATETPQADFKTNIAIDVTLLGYQIEGALIVAIALHLGCVIATMTVSVWNPLPFNSVNSGVNRTVNSKQVSTKINRTVNDEGKQPAQKVNISPKQVARNLNRTVLNMEQENLAAQI